MGSAPSAAEDIERVARSAGARVSQDSQGNSGCRCNRSIYTRRPDPFPCPTTSNPVIGIGTTAARELRWAVSIFHQPVKDIVPLARLKLVRVPFALYGSMQLSAPHRRRTF
jgi:hypothetical protein